MISHPTPTGIKYSLRTLKNRGKRIFNMLKALSFLYPFSLENFLLGRQAYTLILKGKLANRHGDY